MEYNFGFSTNGLPGSLSVVFDFVHDETLNDGSCDGGVDGPSISNCDDFVGISFASLDQPITVGPDTYSFSLLGFSKDGGVTFNNSFQSPERGTNTAGLYGIITGHPCTDVPEPGTLALFGIGIIASGMIRRRRRS